MARGKVFEARVAHLHMRKILLGHKKVHNTKILDINTGNKKRKRQKAQSLTEPLRLLSSTAICTVVRTCTSSASLDTLTMKMEKKKMITKKKIYKKMFLEMGAATNKDK